MKEKNVSQGFRSKKIDTTRNNFLWRKWAKWIDE